MQACLAGGVVGFAMACGGVMITRVIYLDFTKGKTNLGFFLCGVGAGIAGTLLYVHI